MDAALLDRRSLGLAHPAHRAHCDPGPYRGAERPDPSAAPDTPADDAIRCAWPTDLGPPSAIERVVQLFLARLMRLWEAELARDD